MRETVCLSNENKQKKKAARLKPVYFICNFGKDKKKAENNCLKQKQNLKNDLYMKDAVKQRSNWLGLRCRKADRMAGDRELE